MKENPNQQLCTRRLLILLSSSFFSNPQFSALKTQVSGSGPNLFLNVLIYGIRIFNRSERHHRSTIVHKVEIRPKNVVPNRRSSCPYQQNIQYPLRRGF